MRSPSLASPAGFVRSFVGLHFELWGTNKNKHQRLLRSQPNRSSIKLESRSTCHSHTESLRALPPLGKTLNPRFFFKTDQCSESGIVDGWERAFHELFKLADIRRADGTSKRCHSHMLRDTFAIENLLAGVPLDQVSVLLGHASIKTTERHYAPWVRARQEQLEQSVAKAHAVQGITKSAADVTDVPRIERETEPRRKTVSLLLCIP
jgi:Phage integrase family